MRKLCELAGAVERGLTDACMALRSDERRLRRGTRSGGGQQSG